jgi:prophage antirepressor-like protein
MNILTQFDFQGNNVRIIFIDGQPWFIGKDVCDILDIKNSRDALSRLKDYERGVGTIDTPGGTQNMTIISEPGLYRLVITSKKQQAEAFQDWVFGTVLPSIRKTGKYEVKPEPNYAQSHILQRIFEINRQDVPKGYFCVFSDTLTLMADIAHLYQDNLSPYDAVDISVGKTWANYRRKIGYSDEVVKSFVFFFPENDPRKTQMVKCYPNTELLQFREWFTDTYKLTNLPKYLDKKYGAIVKS